MTARGTTRRWCSSSRTCTGSTTRATPSSRSSSRRSPAAGSSWSPPTGGSTTTRGARPTAPADQPRALGPGETEDLLGELLGHDSSLDGLAALIETRTGGNPFFIEEVVQTLVEKGQLTGGRGEYRLGSSWPTLDLPPQCRRDWRRASTVPARVKSLVQTMAVIGLEISEPC